MHDKIYLIIPKLIEQATWGGRYILENKNWSERQEYKGLKIGQSYELFSGTKLSLDIYSTKDKKFFGELGYSMEPEKLAVKHKGKNVLELGELIKNNPKKTLGTSTIRQYGNNIGLLIKYTQAKGNSFQIHVQKKDESQRWKSKSESWFFLEPGLITLGIKKGTNFDEYKKKCEKIVTELENLSQQIKNGSLLLEEARKKAEALTKNLKPYQFVNIISTNKNDLVDLSQAGLHHSWEENNENCPNGNIVYEICQDVMDPVSSIRSFDKGKIKDDGSLREVHIEDYFRYINRDPEYNNPENFFCLPEILLDKNNVKIEKLLAVKQYSLEKITLNSQYSGDYTKSKKSFHHLFVQSGNCEIICEKNKIALTCGHSCFVPADVGAYEISPLDDSECIILKTFIN